MSIRNLDALFRPRSIALVGAGARPGSVGAVVAGNLAAGGFKGPIFPVNPKYKNVAGLTCYPDLASLPQPIDLAVIATPPDTVPALVGAAVACGARAAVVITAGIGEKGGLRQAMLDQARPHLLRVVGPNCVGVLAPGIGLNASFAHIAAAPGDLAFVTQSGAMLTSVLDWTAARGIGFSHLVSLGDMADVDFGDMLDYLGRDTSVRAILLYIEQVTHARKFMSAARAAARVKQVMVVKAGRGEAGAKAAASHTGALAGLDAVYDAAFRRAGMLRVRELSDLFDAAETLAMLGPTAQSARGDRLMIVTNGGGLGVMAVDALSEAGGALAPLSPSTVERLNAILPPTWSHANPIDIIGDADGARYAAAVEAALADENADALLVLNCPTAITTPAQAADAVVKAVGERRRSVLTSWVGGTAAEPGRRMLARARIACFDTPDQAVRGFMRLVEYRRNQDALMQTPPGVARELRPDQARGRAIVRAALDAKQEWLAEAEAKDLLAAYGVPVVPTRVAATPEEAEALARGFDGPVAVKIRSPDITHKSDVGGVALDLATPSAARQAAERMIRAVRARLPQARLDGFTVQPMASRPRAHELIVGIVDDRQFGPVVLVGQGGTAVELADDKALALPPLNLVLAREALSRTRVHRLMQPHRGRPGADLDAVAQAMMRVAQIAIDLPEVAELDINPLLADADGVLALDARVRVTPVRPIDGKPPTAERLAIRPYPQELEEIVGDHDGRHYRLRPIRPEDEPTLRAAFTKLSAHAIRMRFFAPLRALDHAMAARLTQIDYDREMAFVLAAPPEDDPRGVEELYGVGRLSADPDNARAEFAVVVRTDRTGKGLGTILMERILAHARRRGIGEVYGEVLAENTNMLDLCRRLGFSIASSEDDPAVMHASIRP